MVKAEFDFFGNLILLNEQIEYLNWSLTWTKKEYERWYEGELVNVDIPKNKRINNLNDEIKTIESKLNELLNEKQKKMDLVNIFEGVAHKIVEMKYVQGLTFNEIAKETNYSDSYIRKKHVEIKKILSFISKYEEMRLKNDCAGPI